MWGNYENFLEIGGYIKGEDHTDFGHFAPNDINEQPTDNKTNDNAKDDLAIATIALIVALSPIIFAVFYVLYFG
jgi:hypothetical protein